ncbi:MAG: hypothetical protein JWO36_763 [Myxococcales bacterium]|nr:hypothetical protein [Myxococcales bacterium]
MKCPSCNADVFEIDVKCASCGTALSATGAHRMIGQVVLGQYELVDVLGQGGMSVVFKARHKMTDQEVALKILPPELAAHSQVKGRFLDEAKALATLDHANIVHLYNFGQENGSFVLAMQYVQGQTWERIILENKRLDWISSLRICVDVLKALEYAHGRGVVHRDMKPSNVLVRAQDGSATVMDFGIAKMTTSTRLTTEGQTMGTVRYMSPEQVRGQEVDLRTDLYSLGATLFESLVGDTPFDGATHFDIMTKHLAEVPKRPSTLGIELPRTVEDALMRSLSKRAEDRFENARDMRKIFENALREGDVALTDTQKLGGALLRDLRGSKNKPIGTDPTTRSATAKDLADELEPGMSRVGMRRRSKWPLITGVLVVIAGGATAAALLLRHGHGTTGAGSGSAGSAVVPDITIPGVTLTPAVTFPDLHITVATDTQIAPNVVADAYRDMLGKLREFVKKSLPGVTIVDPIDHVFAVPQRVVCEPSLYLEGKTPERCSSIDAAIADALPRTLVVVSDSARLAAAMRKGVADAVCTFQPVEEPDPKKNHDRVMEICDRTSDFLKAGIP